ncbi:unnamed protein product [Ixodes persulcatus]
MPSQLDIVIDCCSTGGCSGAILPRKLSGQNRGLGKCTDKARFGHHSAGVLCKSGDLYSRKRDMFRGVLAARNSLVMLASHWYQFFFFFFLDSNSVLCGNRMGWRVRQAFSSLRVP